MKEFTCLCCDITFTDLYDFRKHLFKKHKTEWNECFEKKFAPKVKRELLDPLADCDVDNKDTVFFHSNLVITGTFDAYPDRNALAARLQSLGADINTSISGKTTVVVMGQGAGPSKIKKIEEWIAKGHDIKIIRERELIEILENN